MDGTKELHHNQRRKAMTEKLTIEDCQLLTEWLGECWHDTINMAYPPPKRRSFTTDKDKGDVFRKLVDNGKLQIFFFWLNSKHFMIDRIHDYNKETSGIAYLFYSPERFCCLVAQAIREGVIKV